MPLKCKPIFFYLTSQFPSNSFGIHQHLIFSNVKTLKSQGIISSRSNVKMFAILSLYKCTIVELSNSQTFFSFKKIPFFGRPHQHLISFKCQGIISSKANVKMFAILSLFNCQYVRKGEM